MNIKLIEASTPQQLEFLANEWIIQTQANVAQILPVTGNANALFLLYSKDTYSAPALEDIIGDSKPKKK